MAAFATAEDLATFIQRDLSAEDTATATLLLDLASAAIRSYTGQTISFVEDDELILSPPCGSSLFLPELPVTAVTSVTVAGTLWTPSTDYYWYDTGMIRLVTRWWGTTPNSVAVVYSHGYATIPDDVRSVCLSVSARMLEKRTLTAGGVDVKSESIGNYSVTYEAVVGSLHAPDDEAQGWRSSLEHLRLIPVG